MQQPRDCDENGTEYVETHAGGQSGRMDLQVEISRVVGSYGEWDGRLRTAAAWERGAAVNPPPRAGILVNMHGLARIDPKDKAVRAPENRPNSPVLGPGLAAVIGIVAGDAKSRSITVVAQHRLIPANHSISPHCAGIAQAIANIDDLGNRWPGEQLLICPNAKC